jgi:hypothetical protein
VQVQAGDAKAQRVVQRHRCGVVRKHMQAHVGGAHLPDTGFHRLKRPARMALSAMGWVDVHVVHEGLQHSTLRGHAEPQGPDHDVGERVGDAGQVV